MSVKIQPKPASAAPPAARPAAFERKRRRDVVPSVLWDMVVFVGGVLCTRSAWVIGDSPFVARVRAEAEVHTFPSACF